MKGEITDLDFDILDALYFVETYEHVLEDVDHPEPIVRNGLRSLIDRGWVQVMEFDPKRGDYFRTSIYDTDDMVSYAYLATKEGLLKHNGS